MRFRNILDLCRECKRENEWKIGKIKKKENEMKWMWLRILNVQKEAQN